MASLRQTAKCHATPAALLGALVVPVCIAHPAVDIGVDSIYRYRGYYVGDVVTPTAVWGNLGDEVSGFRAWFFIVESDTGRAYAESTDVPGIAPGDTVLLTFPSYRLSFYVRTYTFRCSTAAAGDVHFDNDTCSLRFTTMRA